VCLIFSMFFIIFIFLHYGNVFFIFFCVVVIFSLLTSYFRDNVLQSVHHNLPLIAGSVHATF